jgi:uncharacterized protein (TIGR00251 family)
VTSWITEDASGVTLSLVIQPRAGKSKVVGPHGDALKIRIAAPPVDGAANEALIAFLAKALDVPKARVTVEAGETSRRKRVRIDGVPANAVLERLCGD